MMEVTTAPQATSSAAKATSASAKPAISSDFDTFLRMLTTQIQNQDPLNPMDSADFALQLATFSGVEQQVRTNTLLSDLAAQMSVAGLGDIAGWVGMEARVSGPVEFEGEPVELYLSAPKGAQRADLVVTDESGAEVQRVPLGLPLPDGAVVWAGTRQDGTALPQGQYRFAVQGFAGEDSVGVADAESVCSGDGSTGRWCQDDRSAGQRAGGAQHRSLGLAVAEVGLAGPGVGPDGLLPRPPRGFVTVPCCRAGRGLRHASMQGSHPFNRAAGGRRGTHAAAPPAWLRRALASAGLGSPAPADWQPMAGGRSARLWHDVTTGLVVKQPGPRPAHPLFPEDPAVERRCLGRLAGSGLAPSLGSDGLVRGMLMQRFVPGPRWAAGDDPAPVAHLLARIHGCAPPQGVPRRGGARQGAAVLLHGDPVPGNLIHGPSGLVAIDWASARIGPAEHDLALFLSPAMQLLYAGRPLLRAEERRFLTSSPERAAVARYHARAVGLHRAIAAYCLWRARRGERAYAAAARAELARLPGRGAAVRAA